MHRRPNSPPKLHRWFFLSFSLSLCAMKASPAGRFDEAKARNVPISIGKPRRSVMAGEAASKFVARQQRDCVSLPGFGSILSTAVSIEQDTGERDPHVTPRGWKNQCLPDREIKLKLVSISLSAFVAVSGRFAPVSPFSMPARNRFGQFSRKKIIPSFASRNSFDSPVSESISFFFLFVFLFFVSFYFLILSLTTYLRVTASWVVESCNVAKLLDLVATRFVEIFSRNFDFFFF